MKKVMLLFRASFWLCALLVACTDNQYLYDYVNSHMIAATLRSIEIADAAGWTAMGVSSIPSPSEVVRENEGAGGGSGTHSRA